MVFFLWLFLAEAVGFASGFSNVGTARQVHVRHAGSLRLQSLLLHPPKPAATLSASNTSQAYDSSITCMSYSGGSCSISECKAERGPTTCLQGKCICQIGFCADITGHCVEQSAKMLGDYSIKFDNAPESGDGVTRSYLGVQNGKIHSTTSSASEFKVAMDTEGYVRFESISNPGAMIRVTSTRRRGSSYVAQLAPIEELDPLDVSFQVHPQGSGYEIWHADTGVSLTSHPVYVNSNNAPESSSASNGVGVCKQKKCAGRSDVTFTPPLPSGATTHSSLQKVDAGDKVLSLYGWQFALLLICCLPCLCMSCLSPGSSDSSGS